MNETVAPPLPAPGPRGTRLPLAGFAPVFVWGITRVLRRKKLILVAVVVGALGILVGRQLVGLTLDASSPLFKLARVLDRSVLTFGLPLIALVLVGEGFTYEVQSRTLVYHLVRPVSRTTVFLARFFSGALPAAAVALLLLVTLILASGAGVGAQVWWSLPVTAGLGTLALGAVYYGLAALLRHGLIAGLIYTFVVETLISSVPGSMQKLSVMFYVRSLHHGLTEGALPVVPPEIEQNPLLQAATQVTESGTTQSIVTLLAITAFALGLGAWRVATRDWALKE
jgi:ABC-type transport system involved in multi-copper enzyme maturation permease subunit